MATIDLTLRQVQEEALRRAEAKGSEKAGRLLAELRKEPPEDACPLCGCPGSSRVSTCDCGCGCHRGT